MNQNHARTYLVTGAAGFIGSRLIESCNSQKISVIGVDHLEHFKTRTENSSLKITTQVDREVLFDWLEKTTPTIDAIVHLGAITDTRENNPERLAHLNLNYSKKIWDYATRRKIPLIYASSAATYGSGEFGYDDDESALLRLKPLNAYGESKQQFDLWALEREKAGHHPPRWAGFKFFNVYGFGESHKKFMSSVVLHSYHEIQKSGQVTLFKSHKEGIPDGFQKRDFVYVNDVVNVIHFAVNQIQRGIYNLGTGQARTFLDLARAVFSALGRPESIRFIETPLVIRDKYQYFTQAKMEKLRAVGYTEPFSSLEAGIRDYVHCLLRRTDI